MPHALRLGYIGLGLMGKPMATHLLQAGYPLTVFNRSRQAVDELVALGATAASCPREVAEKSQIIMMNLPDSPDVESVVMGGTTLPPSAAILAGAAANSIVVDFSTISPALSRRLAAELAKKKIHWLDAPVTGGTVGAQNATLTIMVGGEKEIFERCLPIFQTVGKKIVHVGKAGSGHTLKLVNQIVCGIHLEALGEAMKLAQRAGLDLKTTLEVLSSGAASSWLMTTWKDRILENNFAPGFKSVHQDKDLRLALDLAQQLRVELPVTKIAKRHFEELLGRGGGQLGTHALVTLFLENAQPRGSK
jgi:3-hydroxyisobutyrate dehydrogenase-like beta-hydroxyacid dehydrogenase